MIQKLKRSPKSVVVFYILALCFALIALFAVVNVTMYMVELAEQGVELQSQMIDVVMYYISNCAMWIFDAAVLVGIGAIMGQIKKNEIKADVQNENVETEKDEIETEIQAIQGVDDLENDRENVQYTDATLEIDDDVVDTEVSVKIEEL